MESPLLIPQPRFTSYSSASLTILHHASSGNDTTTSHTAWLPGGLPEAFRHLFIGARLQLVLLIHALSDWCCAGQRCWPGWFALWLVMQVPGVVLLAPSLHCTVAGKETAVL